MSNSITAENPAILLKKVFGYDEFRPLQEEVIDSILNKRDALLVMPTGGGKSLCYQLPALIFDGLTIVVSPLIALMKDQVDQLMELNINAAMLNSSLSENEYRRAVERILNNEIKLLYISPESLLRTNILAMLSSIAVDCIAIDEAHCISEWGHDFRPEYRQIAEARTKFPEAVCVALTATATQRVRDDIITNLNMNSSRVFVGSFNRENLFLRVLPKQDPHEQILRFLEKFKDQSGIIYCQSRQQVEDLYGLLKQNGHSALPYHAGLDSAVRGGNQDMFVRDNVQIIVATIAFGMGINKPNVRFVVHFDMPKNIETYYQEIGRAGRDGLESHCLLLFSYADIGKVRHFIREKDHNEKRVAGLHLTAMLRYVETEECRRTVLLNYFGEMHDSDNCSFCDNCTGEKKPKTDITVQAQKFLSCVKRTGELFGSGHIIDVLRGSKAKKVLEFGHQRQSTYGIGADHSKKQWLQISRQLMHNGYLSQDMTHGSLQLTGKAWNVLKGGEQVMGYLDADDSFSENEYDSHSEIEYNKDLFDLLKRKRKIIADAANIPPYAVFHDKTLVEMAAYFPRSIENLKKIHGIGEAKLRKYGDIFLAEIISFADRHRINEIEKTRRTNTAVRSKRYGKLRHEETGGMYNAGKTVPDIMKVFGIKQVTVLDHLFRFAMEGNSLESGSVIHLSETDPETISMVMEKFSECGHEYLSPVFNALDGSVNYEELKIIRIYYLFKNSVAGVKTAITAETEADNFKYKQIVCLANSRKYSGRCVAGKELLQDIDKNNYNIGAWIRPVGSGEFGELSLKVIKSAGDKLPGLLDILQIPLARRLPKTHQKENYLAYNSAWIRKGKYPLPDIDKLCDDVDELWMNGFSSSTGSNDRMPVEDFNKEDHSSLVFIRPDNFCFIVEEGRNLLKRLYAEFHFKAADYKLPVTDPVAEDIYLAKDTGAYPVNGGIYICASISEPYQGFFYKLVAGIVGLGDNISE